MELNKKYIKNTKRLPGFSLGSSAIPLLSTIGNVYNSFHLGDTPAKALANMALTTTGNVGGFSYPKRKALGNEYLDQINAQGIGNMINSAIGGWEAGDAVKSGVDAIKTGIEDIRNKRPFLKSYKNGKLPKCAGGLNPYSLLTSGVATIGSALGLGHSYGKAKENLALANRMNNRYNNYLYNNAASQMMARYGAEEYGNTTGQGLPWFSEGKAPGKVRMESPFGSVYGKKQTHWVSPEEWEMALKEDAIPPYDINDIASAHKVVRTDSKGRKISNKKDNIRGTGNPDIILNREAGKYFELTGDLNGALGIVEQAIEGGNGGKKGGLIKAKGGYSQRLNNYSHLLKLVTNTADLIKNLKDVPDSSNARLIRSNANMRDIPALFKIRQSMYPIVPNIYDLLYKTNRMYDMSGGLSASQRTAAKARSLAATQQLMYNADMSMQNQNNQYLTNALTQSIKDQQVNAELASKNYMFDKQFNAASGSARNNKITAAAENFAKILDSWTKNYGTMDWQDRMYSLYSDQNDMEREKIAAYNKWVSEH